MNAIVYKHEIVEAISYHSVYSYPDYYSFDKSIFVKHLSIIYIHTPAFNSNHQCNYIN